MRSILQRIHADQRGATAIEYGLIAALIVIAMMVSIQTFASETIQMWSRVDTEMTTATSNVGG